MFFIEWLELQGSNTNMTLYNTWMYVDSRYGYKILGVLGVKLMGIKCAQSNWGERCV